MKGGILHVCSCPLSVCLNPCLRALQIKGHFDGLEVNGFIGYGGFGDDDFILTALVVHGSSEKLVLEYEVKNLCFRFQIKLLFHFFFLAFCFHLMAGACLSGTPPCLC